MNGDLSKAQPGGKMQAQGSRRGAPRILRSHEDIYALVEAANAKSDDAVRRTDLMAQTLHRVETLALELKDMIGTSGHDDHGKPTGTGVVGDLMRLTQDVGARFKLYDRWMALAIGGLSVGVPMGVVIWWLVKEHIAAVLK